MILRKGLLDRINNIFSESIGFITSDGPQHLTCQYLIAVTVPLLCINQYNNNAKSEY